jgi:hypothetical protein
MWNNPYAAVAAVGGDPSQLPAQAVQEEVTLSIIPYLMHNE